MAFPYFTEKDRVLNIGPFNGGVSLDMPMHEIRDSDSPDMLNMVFENGVLKKRPGQEIVDDFGSGRMLSCFKELYYGYIIYCADLRLRAYNTKTGEVSDLGFGTTTRKGEFFSCNGRIYYVGSGEYYRISFEDDVLKAEIVEGYIPLRYINCDPDTGVGDANEEANFLTGKYRLSYNTKANMTKVYLPSNVDLGHTITVEKDGNLIKQDRFTVYPEGYIGFTSDVKFTDSHNNLVITVEEADVYEDRRKICFCNAAVLFGGSSSGLSEGTRVFLSGNRDYANTFFRSELRNPEYFPVNGFEILGDTLDPITAFGKQGGGLVIFKKNSIYISLYDYSSGEPVFTVTNISPDKGCDLKETIKSADNRLIWMHSKYGVMALTSLGKNNEKNVSVISSKVNNGEKGLLGKARFENATSFICDNRYHLCTSDYCYVLDLGSLYYGIGNPQNLIWYIYSDVDCLFSVRGENSLYLLNGRERITRFSDCLYDFTKDNPIRAHFFTKAFTLGDSTAFKTVKDISLYLRAEKNTYAQIRCMDENGDVKKEMEYRVNKFSFSGFSFSDFTFYGNRFAVFLRRKLFRKRVKFFQVELKNYEPLSDMAVSSLTVRYKTERGVKVNGI